MKKLALLFSLVAVVALIRCSDGKTAATVKVTKDSPVAWKLAVIDANTQQVPKALIKEWEWQLNRLSEKGDTSQERAGEIVVSFQTTLREGKMERDLRSVARAIDSAIPPEGLHFRDIEFLEKEVVDTSLFEIAALTVSRELEGMPLIVRDPSAKRPLKGFKQVRRE